MQQRKLEEWLALGLAAAVFCMLFVWVLSQALYAFRALESGR